MKKSILATAAISLCISLLFAVNSVEVPRYQKNKDVLIDNKLGLMWQDNLAGKRIEKDWYGAKEYCRNLSLAGNTDWRLPNYNEMMSVMDYKKQKPVIHNAFKNTVSAFHWSSERVYANNSLSWAINFAYGNSHYFPKTEAKDIYVLCVRDGLK